ncbi:MAG: hypothetical protein NT151_08290 [Acidobacteria bacterium]|nr:hypothetical protein [Acidobacteriota bacterium]
MRHKTLALLLVAVVPLVACLQKDTSTTIYIRNDGTIEWAVLDQNVRSDEDDSGKRFNEEQAYIDAILGGTDSLTMGFRTLGGTNIRSVVLRDRAPFATLRSADFEHLNQVWERALKSCQVPHRLELKTDGLVTTWTMAIRVDPEPESSSGCDADAVGAVWSTDHLRVMLESGKFLSAAGFKILSADSVESEEVADDTIKKNDGVLVFSLTWKK